MGEKLTNRRALSLILQYIDEANRTGEEARNDFAVFVQTATYYNAISMNIMTIGELVAQLSNNLKNLYTDIPWKQIIGMRNYFAHGYWVMTPADIWETYKSDLPALATVVNRILEETDAELLDAIADGRTHA